MLYVNEEGDSAVLVCGCGTHEHQVRFRFDHDLELPDTPLYIETGWRPQRNFWRRMWRAWRYVVRGRIGYWEDYDELLVYELEMRRLANFINYNVERYESGKR